MKTKRGNSLIRDVQVLILTSELDHATDKVCMQLQADGVQFLRLNREDLSEQELTLDPILGVLECRNEIGTWRVCDNLRSVWWRQGTFDRHFADRDASLEKQMSKSQWAAFMRSMMVFDKAVWVNNPSAVYRAETKAVQLSEASRLGFEVPKTFMTNNRNAPVERSIGADIALKSVDTLLLKQGADQLFGYTCFELWSEVANDSLHLAPATIQHALQEKIDLRVTIIGSSIWCVSVLSCGNKIVGDWRLTPKNDIQIQDYELPRSISDKCIELTKILGLKYGAIDLAYSEGRYWFIEINPTGEWGWLDCDERPIAHYISDFLACSC